MTPKSGVFYDSFITFTVVKSVITNYEIPWDFHPTPLVLDTKQMQCEFIFFSLPRSRAVLVFVS